MPVLTPKLSGYEVAFVDDTRSRAMAINAKFVLALEQPSGPTPSTLVPASEPITAKMNPSADPAIRIQATFRIVLTPSSESVALPNNRASVASVKAGAMGASGVAAPAPDVTDKLVGCMR